MISGRNPCNRLRQGAGGSFISGPRFRFLSVQLWGSKKIPARPCKDATVSIQRGERRIDVYEIFCQSRR